MKQRTTNTILGLACAAFCTSNVRAQIVLNEIFENPPGRGIDEMGWEFIELYGHPNTRLDGYMILLLKGGADDNRDGAPDVAPEIDEVFDLVGCALDEQGFFTLVGNRADGESPIADRFFEPSDDFDPRKPESSTNPRWRGAASFQALTSHDHASISRLDNHGSSTYALVYVAMDDPQRASLRRGALHDLNFDGEIDQRLLYNDKMLVTPMIQVVDEIAWSNRAGREYTMWNENEISESHGLNPDFLARLNYFIENPGLGFRTKDTINSAGTRTGFDLLPTTIADESFLYGVIDTEQFPESLICFDGFDLDGWPQLHGPTDRTRTPYANLAQDPEPDSDPFPDPVTRSKNGSIYLDDIRPVGFQLTPGSANDYESGNIHQQRFVIGDINFDGHLDPQDTALARIFIGASATDTIADPSSPNGSRYKWQGAALQQLLAVISTRDHADPFTSRISKEDADRIERMIRSNTRNP